MKGGSFQLLAGQRLLTALTSGARRYGASFVAEVVVFWSAILAVQVAVDSTAGAHILPAIVLGFPLATVSLGLAEATFRLYRRVWAVASPQDAIALGLAVAEATILVAAVNTLARPTLRPFGILVPVLAGPAAALAVGAFRLFPRLLSSAPIRGNRILFVATDARAYVTIKSMLQQPGREWVPVGILTTDGADFRRTVTGVPVLGRSTDLTHWIEVTHPQGVAFVLDGKPFDHREQFGACLAAELPIFIVPAPEEFVNHPTITHLRELTADDLVGRAPRDIDVALAAGEIANKCVLVTGAAGSIGSELCRVIAGLRPSRLVVLDNNESGLFDLAQDLRRTATIDIDEVLVSITDEGQLLRAFSEQRPDIVFHAAAYKHVPMLEMHPIQAVLTNVIGTRNTLKAANMVGTKQLVLISTDKAVARHSILGCTKRLCEMMFQNDAGPVQSWAVRFGNVVGSRGSVVPVFERQIRQGGPVTITHPEATRYMMTIREAACLVVSTLQFGHQGGLYALDMGKPIKILALAEALIRSRGLRPHTDIEIVFTGLRPGELVTEQLLSGDEAWRSTSNPMIQEIASPTHPRRKLEPLLDKLHDLARQDRSDDVRRILHESVLTEPRPELVEVPKDANEPTAVPAWLYEG